MEFVDPFSEATPFMRQRRRQSPADELAATQPRAKSQEPVDADLLSSIGSSTASGLSRVGAVLDLPGSVVRDVAALENPFDQLLPWNWATHEHRTSGRDLARHWGLAAADDTTANWWLGTGIEALLDPVTYASFGTLTAAGEAARAAGRLPKGLGPKIGQGFASLGRPSLPFTDDGLHFGTGPAAKSIGSGIDTALEAVSHSPPGRFAAGLFDPSAMGQFGELGQYVGRMLHPALNEARLKTDEMVARFVHPIREGRQAFDETLGTDAARWQPHPSSAPVFSGQATHQEIVAASPKLTADAMHNVFEQALRFKAETGRSWDEALVEFGLDPNKMPATWRSQLDSTTGEMQKIATEQFGRVMEKGGHGALFPAEEGMEHFARYATMTAADRALSARRFQTFTGSMKHRSDIIGMIPAHITNMIATDTLARANNEADLPRAIGHIMERYGDHLGKGQVWDEATKQMIPRWAGIGEHAEALTEWASGHPLRPIFVNAALDDWAKHVAALNKAEASIDVAHELAARELGKISTADLTNIPAGGLPDVPKVRIDDYYKNSARLKPDVAMNYLARKMGAKTEDEAKAMIAKWLDKESAFGIPHDIAKAVAATTNFQRDKGWMDALGQLFDLFGKPFMRSVTLPFPSFAGRNLGSGQYVNAASGLMPTLQHLWRYVQHVRESVAMLRTGNVDQALERELMHYGVFQPNRLFEGVESGLYTRYDSLLPGNPLDWRDTLQQASRSVDEARPLSDVLQSTIGYSPQFADRLPAFKGVRKGFETLLGTGAKVNQQVEFLNRVSMYKYLRSEGWEPAAAAAKVKELQIDYSRANFTPFENESLRGRLIPFYAYTRKIAPVIIRNLLERPGGLIGQTIRASRLASGDDPSLPDYVRETMSVPNPFKNPQDGTRSFFTGFGLPFEQLLQYASGSPRDMLREGLSQMNPLVKAPLEWGTGQTFFQRGPGGAGRSLDDLDPTLGRTMSNVANRFGAGLPGPVGTPDWLEFLVGNSPASRFATTARQLSDPRKSPLDLLLANTTGVRVTDISPAAQDAVLKDRAAELMRSLDAKTFEKIYFPKYIEEQMSPQDLEQAHRLEHLRSILERRAKDRVTAKKQLAAAA